MQIIAIILRTSLNKVQTTSLNKAEISSTSLVILANNLPAGVLS